MKKTMLMIITLLTYFVITGCSFFPPLTDEPSGDELRKELHEKIKNHVVVGYKNTWMYFPSTDLLPNTSDKVWDIYSYTEEKPPYVFTYIKNQCGSYKKEGDCYNREHSFPQSWWKGDKWQEEPPMKSDLFHIYPTDGKVNGLRANYPYGIVKKGAESKITENGSKLGASDLGCYTGTVFEPVDEFKGDLARGYFYLMTRYLPRISAWQSPVLEKDNLSDCFKKLLLKWNKQDPVSKKEIERNNNIKNIQKNYNPFIEDPSLIEKVWN